MLDRKDSIESFDKKGMLRVIAQMPKHLMDGLQRGRRAGVPRSSAKNVFVCGMGGSAIGGDLLCEWLSTSTQISCSVCRSYNVPPHLGKDSLVIVASYSGNTEESLSMFEDACRRRAKVVTISSGGQLARLSEANDVPSAKLPTGLVPRASIGYMFGAMLGVIESSRLATAGPQLEETVHVLQMIVGSCGPSVQTVENPAKRLAHEVLGHVPVVIGYGLSRPVAKRWANQLNENSKCMAFSSELPELNHNEIVGWARDSRSQGFASIFLDHEQPSHAMVRRVEATKDMLRKSGPVFEVNAQGLSHLAKMFSLVIMGDYVSTYLGILRKEDPSSTEPIDQLKAVLAKKK